MYVLKLNEKILKFQPIMTLDTMDKKLNYTTFFSEGNIVSLIFLNFKLLYKDSNWWR